MSELDTDNGDNGVFIIGADFKIVGRQHTRGLKVPKADQAKSDKVYAMVMGANSVPFEVKVI